MPEYHHTDIVEQAQAVARREGITLSLRTLAAIQKAGGFMWGPRGIRPHRQDGEFRTVEMKVPAEWSPKLLLQAHQKLKRARKAGHPVPVRVQYTDGRPSVVVREPAPWAVPSRFRRPRGGRPRKLTDDVLRASLARAPSLSQAARARLLKVSRATIARRLARLNHSSEATPSRNL